MPIGSVGQVQDLARCRDDRFVSCPRDGEMPPARLEGSTNASYTETGPGRSPDPVFDPEVGGAERLLRRLYLDFGDHLLVTLVLEAGLHVRAGCEVLAVDPDGCRNHELCPVLEREHPPGLIHALDLALDIAPPNARCREGNNRQRHCHRHHEKTFHRARSFLVLTSSRRFNVRESPPGGSNSNRNLCASPRRSQSHCFTVPEVCRPGRNYARTR